MVSMRYLLFVNQTIFSNDKIKERLDKGYNRILEVRKSYGSFEYKGYSQYKSIWLTAYIVKCLGQVNQEGILKVDNDVIKDALTFLKKNQYRENYLDKNNVDIGGSFVELKGRETKPEMDIELTAFVVTAFLENPEHAKDFQDVIDKALNFIDQYVSKMSRNYEFALVAYAFSLRKHLTTEVILKNLKRKAKQELNLMYWDLRENEEKSYLDLPEKLETASYALLAFLNHEGVKSTAVRDIMMWIISQIRENDGAFQKKDSIVTAQALGELAKIYFSTATKMNLKLSHEKHNMMFEIDRSNINLPRDFKLPSTTRELIAYTKGSGFVILDVFYNYDKVGEFTNPYFLSVTVEEQSTPENLMLSVCTHISNRNEADEERENFETTIIEVQLPEG